MVKQYALEEAVNDKCSAFINARKTAEIGLLIGKNLGSKPVIAELAPTPCQDGVQAARCRDSANKSSPPRIEIDKEWVVEHAALVEDMLPGGLDIVGLYLLCPASSFSGASGLVMSVLKELPTELQGGEQDLVLLHIDAISGKLAAKEFAGGALKPCDLRPSSLIGSSLTVTCRLDMSLLVHLTAAKQRLSDALHAAVERELQQRFAQAVVLFNGKLHPEETSLSDILLSLSGNSTDAPGTVTAELVLPPRQQLPSLLQSRGPYEVSLQRGKGTEDVCGRLELLGNLDCRAFLHRRDSVAVATAAVKQDAARTLRARVRLLSELAEQGQEGLGAGQAEHENHLQHVQQGRKAAPEQLLLQRVRDGSSMRLQLPRRVFTAGAQGAFFLCDHLLAGEDDTTLLSRGEELLGYRPDEMGEVQSSELVATEQPPEQVGAEGRKVAASTSLHGMLVAVGALSIAVLALLLGFIGFGRK